MTNPEQLRAFIRDVPDFPKKGVVFKDITPLLRSPEALDRTMEWLAEPFRNERITNVVGIESRGFIFGSCVARALGAGFIPVRKPGKLPWNCRRHEYALEYGTDTLEIHRDAVEGHHRVLVVDDLLATGGTASAAIELVTRCGATVVACAFVIELAFLGGRRRLAGQEIVSLVRY